MDVDLYARAGSASRAAVVASGLPRAGTGGRGPLNITDLCGSVERLGQGQQVPVERGHICARSGRVAVLRGAREHGCLWEENI